MKLIIDIDEDYYKAIWENGYIYDEDNEDIAKIIKDGTSLEEELKKIKAEIRKKQEINCDMNCNKCEWNHPAVDIKKVEIVKKDIEIIDNHISALKGENK